MRRRDFVTLLGGTAVGWPLAARAQQPAMPVIGFLRSTPQENSLHLLAALRQGLAEAGYVEGQNVTIEYRWAENRRDRLPELAADLVRRQCAVIVTSGDESTRAAKTATARIPIVFATGDDPVRLDLVASFNRPGGNVTGVSFYGGFLVAKQLELLGEMVPKATVIGLLINPNSLAAAARISDAQAAASTVGQRIHVVNAGSERDLDTAFATLVQLRVNALLVVGDPFFTSQRHRLATLAVHHALPNIHGVRENVAAGGLMSFGASITDVYRQVGIYAGRILKGEKPPDLPVMLPTKFELVINLKTAKALGLDVPPILLARADEVIE